MAPPFEFLTDPQSSFSQNQFFGTNVWNQSGSLWTVTGFGESEQIFNTAVSAQQVVEGRFRNLLAPSNEANFGVITNFQDTNNQYLFQYRRTSNEFRILRIQGGVITLLAATTLVIPDNTFFRIRGTSVDESGSKRLKLFADGAQVLSLLETSAVFGAGKAGIRAFVGTTGVGDVDWWGADVNLQLSSIIPTTGLPAGGTTLNLTGTDFADGMRVLVGANLATGVNVTSPTAATAVTPPE